MSAYGVYEVFEIDDLGFVFTEVYSHLVNAYASGLTEARIFIRSRLAHSYLVRWMPGWIRRAPPGGIWRDSQGMNRFKNLIFEYKLYIKVDLLLFSLC